TCARTDGPWADRREPSAWNQRAGSMPKPFPSRLHQQNGRKPRRDLDVNGTAQLVQAVIQACAVGDHLERALFGCAKRFGPLSIFNIGPRPIPPDDLAGSRADPVGPAA